MSPSCDNCGAHVSELWQRCASDNQGTVHACPDCAQKDQLAREAAGANTDVTVSDGGFY